MTWGWTFLLLLLIAIALAILGFSLAVTVLKVLFWIFIALLVVDLVIWLARGGGRRQRPIIT